MLRIAIKKRLFSHQTKVLTQIVTQIQMHPILKLSAVMILTWSRTTLTTQTRTQTAKRTTRTQIPTVKIVLTPIKKALVIQTKKIIKIQTFIQAQEKAMLMCKIIPAMIQTNKVVQILTIKVVQTQITRVLIQISKVHKKQEKRAKVEAMNRTQTLIR